MSSLGKSKSKRMNDINMVGHELCQQLEKNEILLDIRNIQKTNPLGNSKRSHTSSTKRKPSSNANKDNNNSSRGKEQIKNMSYTNLSKLMEDKNFLIANQEKQIEALKSQIGKYRKECEMMKIQSEKKKVEDLQMLKRYERDNTTQIKEIQKLRAGIRELKSRSEQLEQQKELTIKKNTNLLDENEELTLRLATFKEEIKNNINDMANEKILNEMKEEVKVLKEQEKLMKELEKTNKELEEKCISNENRVNQYMIKYNQAQYQLNQFSNKYYSACRELEELSHKYNRKQQEVQELENTCTTISQTNSKKLDQKYHYIKNIEMKAEELITENERINKQHQSTVHSLKIENNKKEETLQLEIAKLKSELDDMHLEKQENILEKLSLDNKISLLSTQVTEHLQTISRLQREKSESEEKIKEKINIIEANIQAKKEYYLQQSERTQQIIREKEELLAKINKELREIKDMVSNYKATIEDLKISMEESERQLYNQRYTKQEEQNKYEEELTYYKNKYNGLFSQNITLSDKICELQRGNTQQINNNTEMMKKIAVIEEEKAKYLKQTEQSKDSSLRKMMELEKSNCNLVSRVKEMESEVHNRGNKINELQQAQTMMREQYEKTVNQLKDRMESRTQEENMTKIKLQEHKEMVSRENLVIREEIKKAKQQLQKVEQQKQKYRVYIHEIQTNNNRYLSANKELSQCVEELKNKCLALQNIHTQQHHHVQDLEAENSRKGKHVEEISRELKKLQLQFSSMNKSIIEESNKKNRQCHRQLQKVKIQLSVVRQENIHLQNIMDQQLEKRKTIIEQLIKEKKILYSQLTHKN